MRAASISFLLCSLLALAFVHFAFAASSGLLSYCDLTKQYGRGSNPSVMPWVNPVQNATFYTIRTADGAASADPTSYMGGEMIPIHLRVLDLTKIYIGVLLYATNSAGSRVGSWAIPNGLPYWTPPTCFGTALTHSDADLKPIHSVFFFTAPPGTGKVTFQIMIKQGEQNKGSFFYPATQLTLTETVAPNDTTIVLASAGQSCNAACAQQTYLRYCNETATAAMTSSSAMATASLTAATVCQLPYLSGCSAMAPYRTPDTDYCYYHSDNCTSRVTTSVTYAPCTATDSSSERFCACAAQADSKLNGAARTRVSLAAFMFAAAAAIALL